MWTAFIWGFGVSCGASFGLLLFFILFWALEWVTGRAEQKLDMIGLNRKSVEALVRRNELTEEMIDALNSIAETATHLESIADAADRFRCSSPDMRT